MTKNIWKPLRLVMIAGVASTALTACGNDGGGNDVYMPPPPPPPPAPANVEDQFGAGFAAAFGNMATADPNPVVAGDVIDPDKTADPVDVPDPN
jgi:hypothetical protein|tara:strand:+ start:245887 stop:246168 length:282 start_codon:yes stop_codon:yes gene_type:complete